MARALHETIGEQIAKAIVISPRQAHAFNNNWETFVGGHPLPNRDSLKAAEASFKLIDSADSDAALIIFAVSGGGSAMIEWPIDPEITLKDLQEANRILVSSGATIAEINIVRRGFSAIKGGKLAARAPNAQVITLIISDTNPGDETSVASGPTLPPAKHLASATEVVQKYGIEEKLPESILRAIYHEQTTASAHANAVHYVLAENRTATEAAGRKATSLGFRTVIADEISEQEVADGCAQLLTILEAASPPVCLISGGEFSCVVKGEGRGGRNLETVLRLAMELAQHKEQTVVLSAGTDGIDGNSPAAGAIADESTIERARSLGLSAEDFLARSDSFTFFEKLGDAIVTGPTETNVRDIRILIRA